MQEAQANLNRTAVEFLAAARDVATRVAESPQDPLDEVSTDLLDLDDLEPAITEAELEELQRRLAEGRLAPGAVVELMAVARQIALALLES